MTKFVSKEDPGYLAVSTELWRWVKEVKARLQVAKTSETPNPETAQHHPHRQHLPPPSAMNFSQQDHRALPPAWPSQQQGTEPFGYSMGLSDPWMMQAFLQRWQGPNESVLQGGNVIEGQKISGGGKAVQGNNINTDKDVTFNF